MPARSGPVPSRRRARVPRHRLDPQQPASPPWPSAAWPSPRCRPAPPRAAPPTLVAYSTPKPAYARPDRRLRQATKARQGRDLLPVLRAFGLAGHLGGRRAARQTSSTSPLAPDMAQGGQGRPRARASWTSDATKGMVTNSIVVVHRAQGQPEAHHDLGRPGQARRAASSRPTPFSSGSAKWNIMAAYGAQIVLGQDRRRRPRPTSTQLLKNAVAQPSQRQRRAADVPVGPGRRPPRLRGRRRSTPRARASRSPSSPRRRRSSFRTRSRVTTRRAKPGAAKAFVAYLLSPAGQKIWGQQGYRPVLPAVAAQFNFPTPQDDSSPSTSLGGWTKVNTSFFDPADGQGGPDRTVASASPRPARRRRWAAPGLRSPTWESR